MSSQTANADPGEAGNQRRPQSSRLIELATSSNVSLFHAPDGTPYADIFIDGHRETHALRGRSFSRWLKRAYYKAECSAPNADAMATALGVLEAKAHFDGPEHVVHLRVASLEGTGRIFVDLCNDTWQVIEIADDGWRILDEEAPVRFRRTSGMRPLPLPERGGSIDALKKHVRVEDADFVLLVSWLLAALRGKGPFPILALAGEQGTGKSFTAELLRSLIDPSTAPLRSLPRDTRDLYVTAINGYVLCFDNLSSISPDVSDALCRLSTGGGFSTRSLFTDNDEVLFNGQRPIALTSINDTASRSDLADRTLLVCLKTIPEEDRRTESDLRAAFDEARPFLFGALLDIVAHGLLNIPHIRLNKLPRMADYAVWIRACETAIWSAGTHQGYYEANRGEAAGVVIESDVVASAIVRYMDDAADERVTTAGELLAALNGLVSESVRRSREWPATARGLRGHLTRAAPALRMVGINLKFPAPKSGREGGTGRRLITITKALHSASEGA